MMEQRHRIAIVDDDPGQRQLLANALERAGYETLRCEDGPQGLAAAADASLMLLDVRMPGMSGLEVLERVKRDRPQLPVILLTAYIDVRDAVSAMKQGALDYLEKPVDLDELIAAVDDALGAIGRAVSQGEAPEIPRGIVAESDAMRRVFQQAARVASSEATVLLLGESGTGKEVVAEFIHQRSTRAERPLVRVNCGGLPANLIESELFGHEKGAFTGADAPHRGRFEEAHEGAIFLDEIGELPLAVQPTLLHVLENGAMRRVGGGRELTVDVRVIAATNRSLEDDVREGRFREDLFYRLNVFALEVPPLRERRDDILPLAAHFLKDEKRRLAPATERVLMAYDWPGNVRELRNAMERAGIMADGNLVLPKDLPPQLQDAAPAGTSGTVLVGDMREIQRRAILEAIEKTGGNKTRAADLLGISRRNLIYKLREYGL
ncbi:MAG TPA: sigma-54 dependent transcriptional regulator [Candidatus Hydrogenedentes bacterium]|jgi:DNA-binding NtrC family response regulator|nr:sigma-54 dependent transcriptional regulator [FCB group bacterium]HNZ18881.1 sigma-54 dependent transcriptional regulator [Candidatus Hydrogenedentota bacterium]HOH34235.1 sigma-54 dependent transcriptional regulator [Candidatus Hydrogenedentota bacterium]HPA03550.1 sigma-54 dependent transcriptional regulator [Candidatus Hydrogenedentota bacterium]HPV36212.1 sigma-54 dependent transcriptional regulator [Candidatus Hydrogenedentota bacterium]